jgi:hypothetical protein
MSGLSLSLISQLVTCAATCCPCPSWLGLGHRSGPSSAAMPRVTPSKPPPPPFLGPPDRNPIPPPFSLPDKASCVRCPRPSSHLSRPEPSSSLLRVNAISKLHRRRAGLSHPSSSTMPCLGGAPSVLVVPSSATSVLEPPFCHGHL